MSPTPRMRFLERIHTYIIPEIYKEKNETEKNRNCEYSAIVKIQSWFRGARSRFYLSFLSWQKEMTPSADSTLLHSSYLLNTAAITIQKHWKGYLARIYYRDYLLNYFQKLCLKHFNSMATKIQKIWRGYQSRRTIFDFYRRKAYLMTLIEKNKILLSKLEEFAEHQKEEQLKVVSQKHQQFQIRQACKEHHLISTKVVPGIYNSPYSNNDNMETFIRSMEIHNIKPINIGKIPEPHRKSYSSLTGELPPLLKKPQGPFRHPKEVQLQRYKPFRPSLRVETDFEHVRKARKELKDKEWTQRIHDDLFLPVRSVQPKYERLLYTQSHYKQLAYGNLHFRETNPSLQLSKRDFKTCLSPISVFDDLNMTY